MEKRQCPAIIGTIQLDSSPLPTIPSLILSTNPTPYFIIPICLGPKKIETHALIDLVVSTCFIDRSFAKLHRLSLAPKSTSVHVEVIDRRPLSSGNVTHETTPL